MKQAIIILILFFLFIHAEAQLQRRQTIPVSIGISEVFNYHIQNIHLGVDVNSCISVAGIVENGELIDPEGNYHLIGTDTASRLQYQEFSKGMDLTLDIPFVKNFGIGLGIQYNFDARDRMRYYVRFYYVFMDWDQKFHFTPALKTGIKQMYTGDSPNDNVFIGGEMDFDVRICSQLFIFVSMGLEYNRNRYIYPIEDGCSSPVSSFDSEEKHDNWVLCGSYGLKFKMWGK